MALQDILEQDLESKISDNLINLTKSAKSRRKMGLSKERLDQAMPVIRQYIAYWREYPDMFIDFMQTGVDGEIPPNGLHLFFYQRVFLRAAARYKYVYMTFPRAYSKSFLTVLVQMVRCVLYPDAKLFVTSGGKEQSASIMKEKVQEICTLIPAFNRELVRKRGDSNSTKEGKDYAHYQFKGGAFFDNIAARESSRGRRRTGGTIEECVGVDGEILNTVILPTMNISRRARDGSVHPEEVINKSQIYITTAGWRSTFAYDKLIQLLVWMVSEPGKAIVLGGTWRIPVLSKLLDKNFVKDLKQDGTFNEASFGREYESIWSGSSEDAFFSGEAFDRCRKLQMPEYEYSGRSSSGAYYVLGCDVGRKGCDTVITVIKVTPQTVGPAFKSLVNIETLSDEHFEDQAKRLKDLYYKYKARMIALDGNGLGIGLLDYMVKRQIDPDTGQVWPDFGVANDEDGFYRKYKTDVTEHDAIYVIKANAALNTEAHTNLQVQISSGKMKFLIEERVAKAKLLNEKKGKAMTSEERAEYLKPFTLTSILKEELLNLREENEGINIILKRANRRIEKDKVSSLEYGLYYIKQEEDNKKRKKKFNAAEWNFFN